MKDDKNYILTSERLGFRNWNLLDIDKLHEIKKVMEFFPSLPTKEQTIEFVERMIKLLEDNKFCYFPVDKLEDSEIEIITP